MRLLYSCLVFALVLNAEEDGDVVLKKIARTVADAIGRSDNYICAQDLSRFYYVMPKVSAACRQPPAIPSTPARVQDRLKLDVAVSNGTEIYSWHGEHKFSAASVGQLVREGPISSGSFNGYLRNIFGERDVTFIFRGKANFNGLDLYQFDYEVPLRASHYQLQAGTSLALAPFYGSFSAKADSYELNSLTVTADGSKIPQNADICSAETRLTYQLVKISTHESLLPASFDLLMGSRAGIFTDSKGRYSECREYKGESTVHFDMDDPAAQMAPAELESEPLKAGIFLPIALHSLIDEDSAYAGLSVEAVLQREVKIKKGVVLPRGSLLQGTITRFEILREPEHRVSLKIEFSSINAGRKLYLCNAIHYVEKGFLPTYVGAGLGRRGMPGVRSAGVEDPSDGSLVFDTSHLHLDKHFSSVFITVGQSDVDAK